MTSVRVMTYNVGRCRGCDGVIDPARIAAVIAEAAPDIVALQDLAPGDSRQLSELAESLGMHAYDGGASTGTAFLSYYPLRAVRAVELGGSGSCLHADADILRKRIHLFNVRLDYAWRIRRRQVATLLGSGLLGSPALGCPLLLLGDFADGIWGPGNVGLSLGLQLAPRPLLHGTFPARLPLLGRDRAYLRGELRILATGVHRTPLARRASNHLPLLLTVQVRDPRNYLHLPAKLAGRMEIAPG